MSQSRKDTLVAWLNDAYAMEEGIVEVLERQVKHMDEMPDVQMRIQQHLELTRSQAERVKSCVERLGEKVSKTKSVFANAMGAMQGMGTGMAEDKVLKDALADYAVENFEIASYMSLTTAAKDVGEYEIARVCEGIMHEEEEMADWLRQQLPVVTEIEFHAMAM
jgi:ferritin-like metal-binding protein YciE